MKPPDKHDKRDVPIPNTPNPYKPLPPTPKREPRFKGHRVTVCIAAIAKYEDHEVVICCTDSRISYADIGTHGDTPQFKFEMLARVGVHVLFSGVRPSAVDMATFFSRRLNLEAATDDILDRFQACATEYRERLVDRYLKLGWSISLEAYRSGEAAAYLPAETLRQIAGDIGPQKIDFECDAIFVCFDNRNGAKLLTMDCFGLVRDVTSSGFAVTGSGFIPHRKLARKTVWIIGATPGSFVLRV